MFTYHYEEALMTNATDIFQAEVEYETGNLARLLVEKNQAYGDAALSPMRVFSQADTSEQIRVRCDDKLSRIKNGSTDEDAVLDLLGYLVLLRIAAKRERSAATKYDRYESMKRPDRALPNRDRIQAGFTGERDEYTPPNHEVRSNSLELDG
jgi:hypothetical protein